MCGELAKFIFYPNTRWNIKGPEKFGGAATGPTCCRPFFFGSAGWKSSHSEISQCLHFKPLLH